VSSTRTRTRPPVTDGLAPMSAVAVPHDSRLVPAVVAVTVVSLAGSVLAVATGLSADWWQAVGPTGRLSVPLPMNAALVLLGLAAAGHRRRLALAAAALLALACAAAVGSGFFDVGTRLPCRGSSGWPRWPSCSAWPWWQCSPGTAPGSSCGCPARGTTAPEGTGECPAGVLLL
jgi:hypothetical protein